MGMAFEIKEEDPKKRRFNWPIIAQSLSAVVGIICVGLTLEAILQDGRFNAKLTYIRLPDLVKRGTVNGTQLVSPEEIKDWLLRNSPLKKGYCLAIGFATSITIVHILIYLILKKEIYRFKFTIYLNLFLAFLYALAALALLVTVLQADNNYGEMFRVLRDRQVPHEDPHSHVSLYIYRFCQVNTGTREEDKIPPVPDRFKKRISGHGLVCQHYSFKMAAVFLAFFNILFFCIVLLTVKSPKQEIRKAIEMAKDLDVEPWMWTHPNGTHEFMIEYVYQQERAKYILKEIDIEPEIPKRDPRFRRLTLTKTAPHTL